MGGFFGAMIGLMMAGPFGALLGFFAGRFVQRSLATGAAQNPFNPANIGAKNRQYFLSTFRLMGHIAKADGRVSEEEIALAEELMQRMQLSGEKRREAIAQFKYGVDAEFNLNLELGQFVEQCGQRSNMANLLLVTLISTAMADANVDAAEHAELSKISQALGFSPAQFEQLLQMILAQQGFGAGGGGHQGQAASQNELELAYKALGVSASDDDKTVKRAYRVLISKHHPDKLIAQGVPDDMVQLATEKSQEIQSAYDLIEKHRQRAA